MILAVGQYRDIGSIRFWAMSVILLGVTNAVLGLVGLYSIYKPTNPFGPRVDLQHVDRPGVLFSSTQNDPLSMACAQKRVIFDVPKTQNEGTFFGRPNRFL